MAKIVRNTLWVGLLLLVSLSPLTSGSECANVGTQCIGRSGYCSGSYPFQPSCVDGYCRCFDTANRDPCTCLAVVGSCHIQRDASNAVGTPTTRGSSETTYSCVTDGTNCNYEVHVISNYESSNGRHGFGITRTRGDTTVNLRVSGQSSKPLILVFVTYEPVNWRLQIPGGVVIEKILLSSYYIDTTDVTFPRGRVLEVERLDYNTLPYGYGPDTGGGHTVRLLQYVNSRFGPVASFSGCYRADSWTLNFQRQPPPEPGCVSTSPPTATTSTILTTTSTTSATTPTTASSTDTLTTPPNSGSECANVGTQCIGRNGYCSGSYPFQPSCVDGYCRCFDTANRDPCTCLAVVGSCHIQRDASNAVGTPTTRGSSETTYSCVTDGTNCNYEVHVISNYESSNGRTLTHTRGDTTVNLRVSGQSSKPLILVFVTYEPVNWRLQIPGGVVIEKLLLSSYYIDTTDVTFPRGRVLEVERLDYNTLPYGYGPDTGGGHTVRLLQYVNSRFGPVASFSGCYRADSWTLNFQRQPPPEPGCVHMSTSPPTSTDTQSTQPNSANVGLAVGLSVFAGVVLIFCGIPCVIYAYIAIKSRRLRRTPVVRTVTSSDPTTRVSSSSARTDHQCSASLSQNNQFQAQPPAPGPATIPPDTACTPHAKYGVFIVEPPPPYAAAVYYPKPQFVYPSYPPSYPPSEQPPSYPG